MGKGHWAAMVSNNYGSESGKVACSIAILFTRTGGANTDAKMLSLFKTCLTVKLCFWVVSKRVKLLFGFVSTWGKTQNKWCPFLFPFTNVTTGASRPRYIGPNKTPNLALKKVGSGLNKPRLGSSIPKPCIFGRLIMSQTQKL